jgi:poly-gamma-glutamate capsule biosynthesis protein CapA/YwtB (metallophosphatase superfamily)
LRDRPNDPVLHESYVQDAREYIRLAEQKHGRINLSVKDDYIWGFALQAIEQANPAARIINLETAVTTSDRFWEGKAVHYRASPANIGSLAAARLECRTLANNRVLDWGYPGLSDTLHCLRQAGMKIAGAGANKSAARMPAILPTDAGNRILVFGLAAADSGVPPAWAAGEDRPGVARLPDFSEKSFADTAGTIMASRRDDRDIVIASIHWGGNWEYDIPSKHRDFAHRLIEEAGVSLVHGHSSHHVKGIEVHRGRLILYGCGDLITDYEGIPGKEAFRGDLGLLYFCELDETTGRLNALHMQPTQMRQMRLCCPSEADLAWLQNTLNREGRRVQLQETGAWHLQWNP